MGAKDKAVRGLTSGIAGLFKQNKVRCLTEWLSLTRVPLQVAWAKGNGSITGPNEVTVTAEDGSTQKIATKNIIIATGSDVAGLPGVSVRSLDTNRRNSSKTRSMSRPS